jgi:hypothetical protein
MSETIKSFVYRAYREGQSAEDTWRAAQSLFPHKCVSWGYVRQIRRDIALGDKIAEAFAGLLHSAPSRR